MKCNIPQNQRHKSHNWEAERLLQNIVDNTVSNYVNNIINPNMDPNFIENNSSEELIDE